jgi:hypothetical protein
MEMMEVKEWRGRVGRKPTLKQIYVLLGYNAV